VDLAETPLNADDSGVRPRYAVFAAVLGLAAHLLVDSRSAPRSRRRAGR
jgi:hypothetical protein